MKVRQLIKRLNDIVTANPDNAEIEIKWWDSRYGYFAQGDCWPVQLFYYPLMKKTFCVINAVDGPPGCYVAVSDRGRKNHDDNQQNV